MLRPMGREWLRDVDIPKVELHVTDVCNNRCSFCTTGWLMREGGEGLAHPPRELLRARLAEAFERGARRALFQGGEPTLRRDLGDVVGDAWDLGYEATTLFTNGRMAASRAGARWLAGMRITWFQLSIQGGTAEAHDASVGAKGAFEQTVAGARRLIDLGQRVKVNAVLTTHLLSSLREFAELMLWLRPEEVGLDTVKPSGAFEGDRESYARLVPSLAAHRDAIVSAMRAMEGGGLVARLTAFPPCLAPSVAHLVSEEAPSTETQQTSGKLVNKLAWKRSLQVKPETCRTCAFDATCGGVYAPYADLHGTADLVPLAERPTAQLAGPAAAPDTGFTRALRAVTRGSPGAQMGVRSVRRLATGAHELVCFGPDGDAVFFVEPRSDAPAYAHTARFSVRYRTGPAGERPHARLLRDLTMWLRRIEQQAGSPRAAQGDEPGGAHGP